MPLPRPSFATSTAITRTCASLLALLALLLVIAAGYVLLAPLQLRGENGFAFQCGSAFAPSTGEFARSVCGSIAQREQGKAVALLVAALVTAAAAVLTLTTWSRGADDDTREAQDA